jgi:hypothetical protein
MAMEIEGGAYIQAEGFFGYQGYYSGPNYSGYALGYGIQGSAFVAGIGYGGVVISKNPEFNVDPFSGKPIDLSPFNINFVGDVMFGVAIPSGAPTPVTGGVFYSPTSGAKQAAVGLGITDIIEAGLYLTTKDKINKIFDFKTQKWITAEEIQTKINPLDDFEDPNAVGPRCFPFSTPIALPDASTRPIGDIHPGDIVLAFDPSANGGRGALKPARVKRLY